jgi:hypothetical protein
MLELTHVDLLGTRGASAVGAVAAVHDRLDQVTGVDPMYAATADKATLLRELTRLITRASALRADVLAVAADVAVEGIARTPGRE